MAPPLDVTVSANRELPGYNFIITGLVRNAGSENYAGLGIVATFFRADGSRHGPIKVNLQCPVLIPGDACPFAVDANAKGLTEVMLHPEGYPTTRTTAQVNISGVGRSLDGIGYVHITGNVTNPNPAPAPRRLRHRAPPPRRLPGRDPKTHGTREPRNHRQVHSPNSRRAERPAGG